MNRRLLKQFPRLRTDRFAGYKGYALACAATALALTARLAVAPASAGLPYIFFFPAVTLSALLAGIGPGMFATALGMMLATSIFFPPYSGISWPVLKLSFWPNAVFLLDGALLCYALHTMHRSQRGYVSEMRESELTQAVLRRQSRRLKQIMDNLASCVVLLDADGTVREINRVALDTSGLRREEWLGRSFPDLPWWRGDDEIRGRLTRSFDAAMAGEPQCYDAEINMAEHLVPMEIRISRVCDEDGKVVGLLLTGTDISERKRAEKIALRHTAVIDTTGEGFWVVGNDGRLLEANQAYATMSDFSTSALIGMHVSELEALEDADQVGAHLALIRARGGDLFETRHRRRNGEIYDVEVAVSYLESEQLYFAFFRDITQRKQAEKALRIAAATFETHEAIMVTDADGCILTVNQAFQRITGFSGDEVLGRKPSILSSGRHPPEFYAAMWRQLLSVGMWEGEIWDRRKCGEIYPKWLTITALRNANGLISEYVAIFSDMTDRKRAEAEIRNLAFYDPLTALPNRRLLLDRFQLALSAAVRSNSHGAVLFLDMDKFKVLNDTLGHSYGDMMLVSVAERIQQCVREVDTVARIGGDEFVILVEDLGGSTDEATPKAAAIAEKIRSTLIKPFDIRDHEYHSSPSIGVCLFSGDRQSVEELLKRADLAMYQAKNAGGNVIRFFDPALQQAVEVRAALEADLRRAFQFGQFQLFYQIQVNNDGTAFGAEALIRWMHPLRGLVSPVEFIPVAEETGMILNIGGWVLEQACEQLGRWRDDSRKRNLILAINVSPHQFRMRDFVDNVIDASRRHGVARGRLKLELTESIILNDVAEVAAKMRILREHGIRLSLDDFGTGYSSLSYLTQLPLDQLKIDQSFIRDLANDAQHAMMVQSIIGMAKNFGLHVIAEGVESDDQLRMLKKYGCMTYQGYYFGKPMPIDDFERLLAGLPVHPS